MKRLFVGNFDFEYHIGAPVPRPAPAAVRRTTEALAAAWVTIAEDGDLVWVPAAVEAGFFEQLSSAGLPTVTPICDERQVAAPVELCPWGWTDALCAWGRKWGWSYQAPPQTAVREANSRRFSFALEREWGVGLPGAAAVRTLDELSAAIANLPSGFDRWVIKAEFSMSARERLLGRGRELTPQTAQWVRKRVGTDRVVFLEPWVERVEEVGLQYTISASGEIVLEGVTLLLTDASGGYRGSRFSPDPAVEERWKPAVEIGRRAAERLQQVGYFGPVGIDATRYRTPEGEERIRPLQDINARYTMGRLGLGLRRWLRAGEEGSWLHVRWPKESAREWFEEFQRQLPPAARAIRTSPFVVGNHPTEYGTIVVITS